MPENPYQSPETTSQDPARELTRAEFKRRYWILKQFLYVLPTIPFVILSYDLVVHRRIYDDTRWIETWALWIAFGLAMVSAFGFATLKICEAQYPESDESDAESPRD